MIIAVVAFISAGQPVMTMRASQPFDTMDACREFLAGEEPGLRIVAAEVSARVGRLVTVAATCIDQRTSA